MKINADFELYVIYWHGNAQDHATIAEFSWKLLNSV